MDYYVLYVWTFHKVSLLKLSKYSEKTLLMLFCFTTRTQNLQCLAFPYYLWIFSHENNPIHLNPLFKLKSTIKTSNHIKTNWQTNKQKIRQFSIFSAKASYLMNSKTILPNINFSCSCSGRDNTQTPMHPVAEWLKNTNMQTAKSHSMVSLGVLGAWLLSLHCQLLQAGVNPEETK